MREEGGRDRVRPKPKLETIAPRLGYPETTGNRERLQMTLVGRIPTKKNRLAPGRPGQKMHYRNDVKAEMKALLDQVFILWKRRPLDHPAVDWKLYIPNGGQDRDGMVTTLLDVLKKGGVIVDDSIRHFNGLETKHPAVIVPAGEERVEIIFDGGTYA
jgi:hypothetical protein